MPNEGDTSSGSRAGEGAQAGENPADGADAPALPLSKGFTLFGEPGVVQRALCSAFAWAATIAPVAFSRVGRTPARMLAVLAILSAIAGPAIVPWRKPLGRHLGISVFLAASLGVWLLTPTALEPTRLDPVLGAIGSFSWIVFALSWGEPWRLRNQGETEENGTTLRARAELPPFAVPIGALGVAAALSVVVLAWFVRDHDRSIAAQAAGVGLAVALVSAAATVAVTRGRQRPRGATVPSPAIRAVIVLVGAIVLGAVVLMLRGGS
ncbi:MAG: hypothetical protein U0271_20630 [Polyangiaceae bacterium]